MYLDIYAHQLISFTKQMDETVEFDRINSL